VTLKRMATAMVAVAVTATLAASTPADAEVSQGTVAGVAADQGHRDGKPQPPKDRFRPQKGVSFNGPGDQTINAKVLRAIDHSPKGSKIRAMTWNFNSWVFVNKLREAHNRGVSVRVIMARTLANEQGPNGPYAQLKRALAQNGKRKAEMRSWFRTCSNSCRGKGGAMHSKLYLFSQVGQARKVVMSSSANMTGSAAANQWNDMYTIVGRKVPYKTSITVFNEAARDRLAPWHSYQDGKIRGWFNPNRGRPDLPYEMLGDVKCQGAKGAGVNGRTSIRIAQDVFNGGRGAKIAKRIKWLHQHGCDIRIVYSQMAGQSRAILAGVPKNHLVRDGDGDGAYDIYLHMKAMAISGNYKGDPGARIVFNGTANWSGIGLIADENGLVIEKDSVERAYGRVINKLFGIHLTSAPLTPEAAARRDSIDPYRNMER
jgi:phosphatidylserine/phosphatidylglycerophosphate/cardiolipin synthase-like enzyme